MGVESRGRREDGEVTVERLVVEVGHGGQQPADEGVLLALSPALRCKQQEMSDQIRQCPVTFVQMFLVRIFYTNTGSRHADANQSAGVPNIKIRLGR